MHSAGFLQCFAFLARTVFGAKQRGPVLEVRAAGLRRAAAEFGSLPKRVAA